MKRLTIEIDDENNMTFKIENLLTWEAMGIIEWLRTKLRVAAIRTPSVEPEKNAELIEKEAKEKK